MKRTSLVVIVIALLGLAIGIGYTVYSRRSTITLSNLSSILPLSQNETTLPFLVDDCQAFTLPSCSQSDGAQINQVNAGPAATYVQQSENPRLENYQEIYYLSELQHDFSNVTLPVLNPPISHSIAQMIAYASVVSTANEKTLILLMQQNNRWWTNSMADNEDPFGIPVKGFFYQTMDAALRLKRMYDMDTPAGIIVIDKQDPSIRKTYPLAKGINKASIALYAYISQISQNPDDFEHRVLPEYQNDELNVRKMWSELFGSDISADLTVASPSPGESPEETLPPLDHLPIPEDITATPRP